MSRCVVSLYTLRAGTTNPLVKLSIQGDCEFDIIHVVRSKRQRVINEDKEDEDYILAGEHVRDRCTPANRVGGLYDALNTTTTSLVLLYGRMFGCAC